MPRSTFPVAALLAASAILLSACSGSSDDENSDRNCETTVSSKATSPAAGALTLQGDFLPDETVILRYISNGETRSALGTPDSERSTFTLTGLPSGKVSYHIIISCNGGQDDLGSFDYTVQ
ncbi:MAG TPA: hypothetical protein VGM77_04305 [Gemmatimonadales bacterium]|jgi:hypothetical protein